jgi:hypothetical protein
MNYERDERITGKDLKNETILLGAQGAMSIVSCTLENCHLIVDEVQPGNCVFSSHLRGCTIEFTRKVKNCRIFSSDYVECTFIGKFYGVDFGRSHRPNVITGEIDELGELIDCDFTQATLDLCRFFGVDLSSQKFAPWPQFVIPAQAWRTALEMNREWPGKLGRYFALANEKSPVLTGMAGTSADFKRGYAVTEDELIQTLDAIGGVIR